jgi:hypothetical protein
MKSRTKFLWLGIVLCTLAFFKGPGLCTSADTAETKTLAQWQATDFSELVLDPSQPHTYRVTSKWATRDIIGNLVNLFVLTGDYTRILGVEGVHCLWNNVHYGVCTDPNQVPTTTQELGFMECFFYTLSEEIVEQDFLKDVPPQIPTEVVMSLIWDAPWIDVTYQHLDEMVFAEPLLSVELQDFEFDIQSKVHFKMRNLVFTWTGITTLHGEVCAQIEYQSLSNPITPISGAAEERGRSCYWGNITVSLEDKEVECFTMFEDVIIETTLSSQGSQRGQSRKQFFNIQREVEFEKQD